MKEGWYRGYKVYIDLVNRHRDTPMADLVKLWKNSHPTEEQTKEYKKAMTQEQDGMKGKFDTTEPMRYKYSCRNCKVMFISPFKEPLCKYCGSRDLSQHK